MPGTYLKDIFSQVYLHVPDKGAYEICAYVIDLFSHVVQIVSAHVDSILLGRRGVATGSLFSSHFFTTFSVLFLKIMYGSKGLRISVYFAYVSQGLVKHNFHFAWVSIAVLKPTNFSKGPVCFHIADL